MTSFSNSTISSIGGGAFALSPVLVSVNFSSCTNIGVSAF